MISNRKARFVDLKFSTRGDPHQTPLPAWVVLAFALIEARMRQYASVASTKIPLTDLNLWCDVISSHSKLSIESIN